MSTVRSGIWLSTISCVPTLIPLSIWSFQMWKICYAKARIVSTRAFRFTFWGCAYVENNVDFQPTRVIIRKGNALLLLIIIGLIGVSWKIFGFSVMLRLCMLIYISDIRCLGHQMVWLGLFWSIVDGTCYGLPQGDIIVASVIAGCDGYPAEVPGELTNQKAPRSTIIMEVMQAPKLSTGKVIKIVSRMVIWLHSD